jgi:PAS domain S-box-containing protein
MLAYGLIILRGVIPDWMSVELGNSISVVGIYIGYLGLEKFAGKKMTKVSFYLVFMLIILCSLYFTLINPAPTARYAIISAAYLLLFGQCAWLMFFRVRHELKKITKYPAIIFAGLSFLSAIKIIDFFIRGDKPVDYFQSDLFEAVTMIAFGMLIVLLAVSIANMLNANLLMDIRAEEEKFAIVFHTTPTSIILSEYPEGKLIEVNDKFFEITGYDSSEVIGKTYSEIGLWASGDERHEIITELKEKGSLTKKQCSLKLKSGDIISVLMSVKIISAGNGRMYVSSISDVSGIKKLQDEIRHESNLLRTLVDNLPDPVSITDIKGKYLLNNKAHLNLLGADTQDETIGRAAFDFLPEEDALVSMSENANVLSSGKMIIDKIESAINQETGFQNWHLTSKIPISNDDGNPVQVLTINHDITEKKRAEDILRDTDEFNRSLLATIPYGMDVVDENGTLLFIGEKFRNRFGKDAIGKKCWELYCDSGKQCPECPLKNGLKPGSTAIYEAENILGERIFEINHTVMMYNGKKALLEIFHDITERKKGEDDLIRSKERAEESDRLKTAFLHNISHEIRTPMNAIVGFANLLHEPGLSDEDHNSYIDIISRSSNHLLSIVNDVIEISNIEAGQLHLSLAEEVPEEILSEIYMQFQHLAREKDIEFKIDIRDDKIVEKFKTDRTKFIQIFSNLLNNAFKFTSSGSIVFGYTHRGPDIEFFVKDTGIGIDEASQKKIFDRFYQVDNTVTRIHEGTGIGLSISKAYVELLGGTIWVSSVPGQGSEFFFRIPQKVNNAHSELQMRI